ncbi:hypothetical protein [Acinetobacter sp. YH12096]|uniref:hypothetical protein n=1 Tax=Acinetobacter sp. YH12096 TaxID=2601085 RepID=UPI0015D23915|nr:hypothetical protein [Acinetobacter sp. YH12096]
MDDIKDYLIDKISVLKFNINMILENFYYDKGVDNFTYPYEIINEIKNNIIEDGVKDEVETTSIGIKYLIRNFGNKQDESTEFFYLKMMISIAFCEFYLERNNLSAVIRHLNNYYFNCGVNESKNEKKIQRLQMSDNGRKKGQSDSLKVQEIIKSLLPTRPWKTREEFYFVVEKEAISQNISRGINSIRSDFIKAVKGIPDYKNHFKHKGKK